MALTFNTPNKTVSGWTMHLVAVLILTVAALGAIFGLTLAGKAIPDIFNVVATGGVFYFIGTQTKDKFGGGGGSSTS